MSNKIEFDQNEDHVFGKFQWEIEPKCCDLLKTAIEEDKFVFCSNFTGDGKNQFYIMPVDAEGYLVKSSGIPISFCPWCGTQIKGRKLYKKREA